jgi:two-component system alkaline phosphatase synthesis response regulator PhoP
MFEKKILIVDDEKNTLFILEKELEARGYSVITADNGNDALKLAKSKYPDLIILDIWMPEMDGAEVAAGLKEDIQTKNIPVIFLTCLLKKREEGEQGLVIADRVYIAKPYDIEGLVSQIERLVNRQCVHG